MKKNKLLVIFMTAFVVAGLGLSATLVIKLWPAFVETGSEVEITQPVDFDTPDPKEEERPIARVGAMVETKEDPPPYGHVAYVDGYNQSSDEPPTEIE